MSEIRDEIQDFHNRRKLHILKGFSDFDNVFEKSEKGDELQKARYGRYADNAQNRKLQRVGQEYGQAAKEKEVSPGRQPKGEEEETGGSKQPKGDNPIQNFAKEATDEQLEKYLEKNPNGEHAEAAKQELLSRGYYDDSGDEIDDYRNDLLDQGFSEEEADRMTQEQIDNGYFEEAVRDEDDDSGDGIGKSSPNPSDSQPKEQREDLSGQFGDGEGFRNLNEELNDDNKTEVLSSIDNLGYNSEILMDALDGDFNLMLSIMKESDRNEILSKIDGMKPVSRAELEETMKKMRGGDDKDDDSGDMDSGSSISQELHDELYRMIGDISANNSKNNKLNQDVIDEVYDSMDGENVDYDKVISILADYAANDRGSTIKEQAIYDLIDKYDSEVAGRK